MTKFGYYTQQSPIPLHLYVIQLTSDSSSKFATLIPIAYFHLRLLKLTKLVLVAIRFNCPVKRRALVNATFCVECYINVYKLQSIRCILMDIRIDKHCLLFNFQAKSSRTIWANGMARPSDRTISSLVCTQACPTQGRGKLLTDVVVVVARQTA